ncbi:MAG: hypothetical protein R2911_37275 [Caldilineaceae bacterium]
MAVAPAERTFVVLIEMQVVSDRDLEAVDHILDSFVVDGLRSSAAAQGGDLTSLVDTSGLIYEYTSVQDGAASALVPSDWTDVESDDWLIDGDPFGKQVTYAVSVSDFREQWTGPGVLIQYADTTDDVNIDNVLDSYDLSESCTNEGRLDHEHTVYGVTYTGKYDVWTDCQKPATPSSSWPPPQGRRGRSCWWNCRPLPRPMWKRLMWWRRAFILRVKAFHPKILPTMLQPPIMRSSAMTLGC